MLRKILAFLAAHHRPLVFCGLAALLLGVYWPSLRHIARGDQVTYLAEMASRHGFADTALGTFDLNRTRSFGSGDVITLFRPVLYLLLGFEKFFFGYDYFWWQAVALAAHVFVAAALYALLCRIQGGVFALLATGIFIFLPVNIEAVVWHHISAYMLFAGFVLMVWRNLLAADEEPARASQHFGAALGWMMLAVFSHEAGVWYLLVIAGYLAWRRHGMMALASVGLVMASLASNALDLWWRQINVGAELGPVVGSQGLGKMLANAAHLAKWFFSSGFFLDAADMRPVSRMMVSPEVVAWPWPWGAPVNLSVVAGTAFLAVLIAGILLVRPLRAGVRQHGQMLAACTAMVIGYILIIVIGRINPQGEFGMRVGLYYPYNFFTLVIVIVALAAGGDRNRSAWSDRVHMIVKIVVGVAAAGFMVLNAVAVWRVTDSMARDSAPTRQFLYSLDGFVRQHAAEPGFSFYVAPGGVNYVPDWVARRGDPAGRQYSVVEALYPQYYTKDQPKFNIRFAR